MGRSECRGRVWQMKRCMTASSGSSALGDHLCDTDLSERNGLISFEYALLCVVRR